MAFDALQSSFPTSFFPTFQPQASVHLGNGNSGRLGLPSDPASGVSRKEPEAVSSAPWFDDPYELTTCTKSSMKSSPACDEESDLQGLVSSILDEADSQYSYFSEGKQLNCKPVWSPRTQREELLHCLQSEAKTPNGLAFSPNRDMFPQVSVESPGRREPSQPPNGLLTHQWPPNSFSHPPLRPPPGLPAPKMGNILLSQLDRFSNVPSEAEPAKSDMNSFGLRYVDVCRQSGAAPEQQEAPSHLSPLVSGFQALLGGEPGGFQHVNRKMPHHEDGWRAGSGSLGSSSSSALMSAAHRQLLAELRMQQERHRDVRRQPHKYAGFPEPPVFSRQSVEFSQQQNHGSAAFIKNKINFQNQNFNQRDKQWVSAFSHRANLRNSERKQSQSLLVGANMQPFNLSRFSAAPGNPPIFSSRHTPVYGGQEQHAATAASEAAAFHLHVTDALTRRGEGRCHMTSARMDEGEAVMQLYFHLDECYEQGNCLEKERKKNEIILSRAFPGKRTADVTNPRIPKTPLNPTRVDHLILSQMREQAKMMNLAYRMECLSNSPLHPNVHTALKKHDMAVRAVQTRRREELANMSREQRLRAPQAEARDTLLLAAALQDLAAAIRSLRTALWCGLQTTLPEATSKPETEETASPASSPLQGYSFNI